MDIPDDLQPGPAPAAVTRRAGESYADLELRRQGYDTSGTSRRAGPSALERAYNIALKKKQEQRISDNEAANLKLEQDKLQLRRNHDDLLRMKEAAAVKQKSADQQNELQFMSKVHDLQDKYISIPNGLKSPPYLLAVQEAALQHGIRPSTSGTVGPIVMHAVNEGDKVGAGEDVASAAFEIHQITHPEQYGLKISPQDQKAALDLLPVHYPTAFDKPIMRSLFADAQKAIIPPEVANAAAAAKAGAVASATTTARMAAEAPQNEIKQLESELSKHQSDYQNASNRHLKALEMKIPADNETAAMNKLAEVRSALNDVHAAKSNIDSVAATLAQKKAAMVAPSSEKPSLTGDLSQPESASPSGLNSADSADQSTLGQDLQSETDASAHPDATTPSGPDIHDLANAAIAAGKHPELVKQRLIELGGDPAKLTYDD